MKTKIKGEWVEFDYSIDALYNDPEKVVKLLKDAGFDYEYLGKSRVFMSDGKIRHLRKKHLFFKKKGD